MNRTTVQHKIKCFQISQKAARTYLPSARARQRKKYKATSYSWVIWNKAGMKLVLLWRVSLFAPPTRLWVNVYGWSTWKVSCLVYTCSLDTTILDYMKLTESSCFLALSAFVYGNDVRKLCTYLICSNGLIYNIRILRNWFL